MAMVVKITYFSRGHQEKMLQNFSDGFGGDKGTFLGNKFIGEDEFDAVFGSSIGSNSEVEDEQIGDLVEESFDKLTDDNDLENN